MTTTAPPVIDIPPDGQAADTTLVHDPQAIGLVSHTTATDFGSLHYVAPAKRASEEVVLFLHGFGSNWSIWTPLIKAVQKEGLLKGRDCLLVDLPSFGKSENLAGHLRSAEMGQTLLALCHRLGYRRIRVVGHSMGGFLTLDMAARHPSLLSVHIVAGSYLTLLRVVNHPLEGLLKAPGITTFYGLHVLISKYGWLTALTNRFYKRAFSRNKKALYELGGKSFLYASRNGIDYDAPRLWGSITMPVYGVFGGRDKLVSQKDMAELQAILPQAHLTIIQGAGHSLLVTEPVSAARALFGSLNDAQPL